MRPYYSDDQVTLWHGDALAMLAEIEATSVDCVLTSPPYYGLRDYGTDGQYGLEPSPAAYVETMRAVFAQVRRVLAADGTLWLNLGDCYSSSGGANRNVDFNERSGNASGQRRQEGQRPEVRDPQTWGKWNKDWGLPSKNLLGMPWRVAFALQADGWIVRKEIIWHKPNPMPESIRDRPSSSHETLFLLARSQRYHFDLDAIREPLKRPEALAEGITIGGKGKGDHGGVGDRARTRGLTVYGRTAMPPQSGIGPTGARHTHKSEAGRNPGDTWEIDHDPLDDLPTVWRQVTQPFPEAHFAVMPYQLAERCLRAGLPAGGLALDPFCGSGTTGMAAIKLGGRFVGIDLNREYLDLALRTRLAQSSLIEEVTP